MNGILIDTLTNDLLIEHGHVTIGNTDSQTAEGVIVAMRGEWKEWPLIGGEIEKMLAGKTDVMWPTEVKKMLRACGLDVQRVDMDNGIITVE